MDSTATAPPPALETFFSDLGRGRHQFGSIGLGLAVLAIIAGIVVLTDLARHEEQPEGL